MDIQVTVGEDTKVTYLERRPHRGALIIDVTRRISELVAIALERPTAAVDSPGELILVGDEFLVVVDGTALATEQALSLVLAGLRRRFAQGT